MSYGGVLFCIGPSAPCLMSLFAIVTGGAGVPARDVISTRKTHVPIIVVFVGVGWRGCSTGYIGCWYCSSIGWWLCGRWSVALYSVACPATSSLTASETLFTTTSVCSLWCWLINVLWNRRVRWWYIRDRCVGRRKRWYVCMWWCLHVRNVGGVAGGAPSSALVNIASCCCVCNNAAWSSRVSTVNADTLSLVACAEVFLASWTCCSWAIKPLFMDAQLSYYNPSVLFAL